MSLAAFGIESRYAVTVPRVAQRCSIFLDRELSFATIQIGRSASLANLLGFSEPRENQRMAKDSKSIATRTIAS